jgi:hypothetical protein
MVHMAGMAGRGPWREPALDLVDRATAEHFDQIGAQRSQPRGRLRTEVGVEQCRPPADR